MFGSAGNQPPSWGTSNMATNNTDFPSQSTASTNIFGQSSLPLGTGFGLSSSVGSSNPIVGFGSATAVSGTTVTSTSTIPSPFGQTAGSVFGQGSATLASSTVGTTLLPTLPTYGQSTGSVFGHGGPTLSSTTSVTSLLPAPPSFGQTAGGVFGQGGAAVAHTTSGTSLLPTPPSFGQTTGSVFGQGGATLQSNTSVTSFPHAPPSFGQASGSVFGHGVSKTVATSAVTSMLPMPPAFGQSTGNVFGQSAAQSTHTTTGTTVLTTPSPFGQTTANVFGQSSVGMTATTAVTNSSTTPSLFGQTTRSVFGQSGSGSALTTSVTSLTSTSSPFGQTTGSIFGQSAARSAPTTTVTSLTSTPSAFGQNIGSAMSQQAMGVPVSSVPAATTGFGGMKPENVFGTTSTAFGATNTFSSGIPGSTQSASITGDNLKNKASFTASKLLGGISSGDTTGKAPAPSFGASQGSTSHPATTSTSVFGQGMHASRPASTTAPVFSSSAIKQEQGPGDTSSRAQTSAVFGGVKNQTSSGSGLFSAAAANVSPSGFAGQKNTLSTSAAATPQTANTGLFGTTSSTGSSVGPTPTFGGKFAGAASSSGQPGTSATLFGKPAPAKTSKSGNLSGSTPSTTGDDTSAAFPSSSKMLFGKKSVSAQATDKASSSAGLFGKPASPATTEEATVEHEEPTREAHGGLFGKPASTSAASGASSKGLFAKPAQKEESPESPTRGRRVLQRNFGNDRKSGGSIAFGRALAGATGGQAASSRRPGHQVHPEKGTSSVRASSSRPEAQTLVRRRSTLDDLSQYTVLVAKNLPSSLNNKNAVRKHFSRHGAVSKVFCTPNKNTATITFEDHESALNAKKNGSFVRSGLPKITLFWKSLGARGGGGSPPSSEQTPSKVEEAHTSGSPKRLFSGSSSEVDQELQSLGRQSEVFGVEMTPLERPSGGPASDPLAGTVAPPPIKSRGRKKRSEAGGSDSERRAARTSRRKEGRAKSPVSLPLRHGGDKSRATPEPPASKIIPREDTASPGPSTVPLVSLKSVIGKRCTTAEDCLEVLEARDRVLREARNELTKGTDLATARIIQGTCVDMCPEKERYLRQARRRVAVYELDSTAEGRGVIDHARAVKEYSRSSADQDMPLANELRPPEVLERTMIYILNNIIPQGTDGKWSDWYEFVWSRTRSIRKDITQQQLCNQTAVSLVERCARFHIYCAERLCEEDAAVFDMKINDENLTKCLQTLKEMYHDLATKHNQRCPNEAEFRAYIVLMNLNEGDILRETQQLPTDLRESSSVKFALAVYSALNSNNYIGFFKLVRRASFLSACILHRYFNQARSKALLTMVMAYSVPGKPAQVPVKELVRLLSFEDDEEVLAFCEHYCVPVEQDHVLMARHTFSEPESALAKRRAQTIIESKLLSSAGEIINGGPLPPNEIMAPTSSFDADGRFCPDAATLQLAQQQEDSSAEAVPVPAQAPGEREAGPPSPVPVPAQEGQPEQESAKPAFSNDAIKAVAKDIFLDVIDDICQEMSQNLVKTCQLFLNMAEPLTENLLQEQVPLLIREVVEEEVHAELARREREARARAELSALRERAAQELTTDIINTTIQQLVKQLAVEIHEEVDRQLAVESRERCSAAFVEDFLLEVTTQDAAGLARDFFINEVDRKRKALATAKERVNANRRKRYFRSWKNKLAVRQRLKRAMLDFPAAPTMEAPREVLERLLPDSEGSSVALNAVHLGQKAWLTLTPPNVIVEGEAHLFGKILRQNEEARQKLVLSRSSLNMCQLVGPVLAAQKGSRGHDRKVQDIADVYWKLVLCLPQTGSEEDEDFNVWISNKLSSSDDGVPPELYHPQVRVIGWTSGSLEDKAQQPLHVHVTTRQVAGIPSDIAIDEIRKRRHLQGTDAVLYVVGGVAQSGGNAQFWEKERCRFKQTLQLWPDPSQLSLLVVLPGDRQAVKKCQQELSKMLGIVAFSKVVAVTKDTINPLATLQVQEAVRLLAEQSPSPPRLQSDIISSFVEHGLQRFFYNKLRNSVFCKRGKALLDQVPAQMVSLYNAVVVHLSQVASDESLKAVSWPPIEFCHSNPDLPAADWNSPAQLGHLHQLLIGLCLPGLDSRPDHAYDEANDEADWMAATTAVWRYVRAVALSTRGTDVFLISRVRAVLLKAQEAYEDLCYWSGDLNDVEPAASHIPWSSVVFLCIDHKLAFMETLTPDDSQKQLDYDELKVHYEPELLDAFVTPEEWLAVCQQSPDVTPMEKSIRRAIKRKQEDCTQLSAQTTSVSKATRISTSSVEVSHAPSLPSVPLARVCPELLEAQTMATDLLSNLNQERQAMDEYEQYLQDLLKEGEIPLAPVNFGGSTLASHANIDSFVM